MIKPVVTRNLMLDFIPDEILCPENIHPSRVSKLNEKPIKDGDIIYVMSREFRINDNWGFLFAHELAKKHGKKLQILLYLDEKCYSKRQIEFMQDKIESLSVDLNKNNIQNNFVNDDLKLHLKKAGAVVVDFNPINLQHKLAQNIDCATFEVDSHNIIPTRFISQKQEFSAATLRKKVYGNISEFLTEFNNQFIESENIAKTQLKNFIENRLDFYTEQKNDPNKDVTSNLSKYLHCGMISSQRIALEVLKSNVKRENKEACLEELIVRKELSDNFCLYAKSYTTLESTLDWAKNTLNKHKTDIRSYTYNLEEFENAKTHDSLWNACQHQLIKEGRIHGYLRMYWAKKILEWSNTPEEALEIAIFLNDKYALDGCDPNGYVGILWSIGGIHDRAFSERLVSGKIRYMSFQGCKNKFDTEKYILNVTR